MFTTGFRSSFRDRAGEMYRFSDNVAATALRIRRPYQGQGRSSPVQGDLFARHQGMLQHCAEYLKKMIFQNQDKVFVSQ